MMDGVFNNTVHSKPLSDVVELKARIAGLLKRIGDLQGENKILKAKIHGQRAVIRKLQEGGAA